jgi:hypothetical protein
MDSGCDKRGVVGSWTRCFLINFKSGFLVFSAATTSYGLAADSYEHSDQHLDSIKYRKISGPAEWLSAS